VSIPASASSRLARPQRSRAGSGPARPPGTAFGPFPERVRFSLATRKEDVVEAVRRLREHYAGPGAKK
jgi:hypothetical protein